MDAWIPITIAAGAAQTLRFMLQRHLRGTRLSTAGATFARFLYSAPLVAALALLHAGASGQALPGIPPGFWAFAFGGGIAQIVATMCVLALFQQRNFAVGLTFKNTEVLLAVPVGLALLGEGVSLPGLAAILLGVGGVLLLSDPPGGTGRWHRRILNRAAGLGIAAGLLFAVSGVGYRGAALSLEGGGTFQRAVVTLAVVTLFQTAAMALWLVWRERGEIGRVIAAWRVAGLVGLTSMVGSLCWFTAFTLQTVAYVKALGQVELIFGLIAAVLFYGEKPGLREMQGLGLLLASIIGLVLLA